MSGLRQLNPPKKGGAWGVRFGIRKASLKKNSTPFGVTVWARAAPVSELIALISPSLPPSLRPSLSLPRYILGDATSTKYNQKPAKGYIVKVWPMDPLPSPMHQPHLLSPPPYPMHPQQGSPLQDAPPQGLA